MLLTPAAVGVGNAARTLPTFWLMSAMGIMLFTNGSRPEPFKGLLPGGTVVAHKTGTATTVMGLNGATNDAGVVTLPNGAGQLAIAIYVRGSTRDQATRESVIARMAKAAFDYWLVRV